MAERPLYTLYKNLKAQNYDVPDDYNKFESALTRDGKSGADNRHAIYENLKAQNFDVPSTYERFYSALFEPRSRTSSRAKGGSVPMSAADRARYLAVTQSVLNTARQVKRASGNIRKTVERAKKFNANDGKVTIGFKNPLQNQNVQKNEFNYNATTGKAGTYTTTDGVEFDNEYDAAQHQNKLDKYGEEWNKAVDMGMVPSELDKADPGLSDTDVAMRQMERRQEWIDENQNRRSKELNESMHLQDSPFVASGGAVAPSSFNTAISNEANRLSDVEYGAYNTAKAYNQMLRTTLLQELKEQKQRNENAGWWKDKWNDVSNYFGAMFNTMLDPKLYSHGVMDAAVASNLLQVKKGMEDGTIKKGSNAGNAAQVMLSSIQQQQGEAAKQQQYGTKAYQYGDVSGRSLKFMADFALSGWRNVMTTGFTKAGEKVGEKMALGTFGKWFTKNTGRVLGDMAGSAALAATNQLGSTYNNVIERYVGMNNENGGVTQDKDGDLKFNEGVRLGKAIKDGLGSATIENFSEMFGEYLPGASKLLSKLGLSKVSSFFEKIGNNAYYKWLSNATNKSGIQGVMAEISEEEFGTALHAAWGDGDGSWSDFNVFTNPDAREKQIDTCLGMFYSVGFMQSPRTAVGAVNAVKYFNIKHQVNKADKFGQMMFGENWDEIKNKIDVTTNADLTKTVLDATRSDSMNAKQKGAVINYAMFLSKLRGFNQASDAKTKDKVEEGDTAPTLSNDLDDAYTEGHNADDADKHDIQIQHEDQSKTLAAALNISEQQLSVMSDEELESLTGQDDKLDQAIYDYQLSSARYQGVVDDAQDKVDLAAHQAEQRVNMYTDKSRGSVRNATIKASGGAEDYGVYIISGNIATHEDGSIDVSNSDDMILYFDPTTNSVEHADALMFAELGEELPADEVKVQAVADAKENAIKEVAGIIDGTVEVGSQFSVTDEDGTGHTYEVLADNGDGTAMITIDGNVPTELVNGENVQIPYSFADLQQMKDLEDQKRLEAAKAEREQIEKERDDQQTEQTQPSFDFNQIINDNGNVVLVDVLDKDGNTKYPDSKLFLIRDTGAKAKVVELKSDGTIVPHAVNKEDVATISSMSLDEYKQAMPESSMIEDNSGEESDEDSQLANLGLPKGSEIWMSGDGFGRPKENTLSKVVGIDEQGSIILEDKDGKKWSASFDYINNHRELPPLDENTNIVNEENNQSESNAEENTPAPEQTPAITLEDGTIVPMLEDGNPDFSKLTAAQTAELYDTQFGEDAESVISSWVSDSKKALDKANNMTVKGKTFVEQKASKDAKEKAIADAHAAYDSAIAIRDAYNERQLAKVEDTAEGRKALIEKARRKFARLKSSVKDDAEAVAQIYKETVGSLLHRLYDSTGIDVTDTIPLTAEEYVASNLGAHSINYEGTETSKSVKQETGLSREDFAKTQLLAADGKGTTIDALVHSLWENRPSNLDSLDTQDIRNALVGVLTSGFKASEARSYVENIRIAQAEKLIEEERNAAENAAYYEQQKAKEEEEKKKAELEKADEKAHSESFNKIVDLAKNLVEILDNPDNVKEIDKITHEIDELLETLSDEEFKEVSDVLLNIDEDLEYLTADEYERREGVEESKKAKAYNESLQQAIKRIAPYADALKEAVKSGDKKDIAKAQKELTDALIASNLGHGYLYRQLEYAKSVKKKDESYSERRALVKPLTEAINAIESALDSALAEAGLEGVHVDFTEGGHGWIYADKGSVWSSRLKALDNDYRNVSQYETQNPISVLPQVTIDNVEKVAGIIKSRIEEGERYNSDEYNDEDEQTNENINSLTPEQQKAKEDGEKLGFPAFDNEGEPINQNVIELANWAKEQGLEIDPTSKMNSYADLYLMCKDGFGVSTLVPDVGEDINQVFYFPDNVQGEQLLKLQEEFNVGRDLKHSADMNSELTEGVVFYDGDTAREFKEFVDKKVEEQNKVFGEQIPEEDLPFSAKENGTQQTTAERDADVEKNKVDDMKVVDNIVGNKTRKAFERLAKMMGANIQWQYSDKLGNGWIQDTTDADGNVHSTIFITLDSSITEGAQFIFGHEMTHQIKNLNPDAYNELTQLVIDTYGSDAFDKAVYDTMQRYSDAGFSGRNRDYYAEEVVADAVGEMIRDLNLAHTLAMKMSHPLLAAIHEILQKIKLAFFGTEYSDVTKNIIRSIEQAYVKSANREAIDASTQEGEGGQRLSLRTKPEPKKTQKVYKLMRLGEDGKLYPLFIGSGEAIELGKWYDADSPKLQDLTSLSSKDYVGTRTAKKDGASVKEEYHYGAYIVNNKTGEAMSLADFKAKYSKQFDRMGNNPNKKAVDWATDNGYRWIKIEEKNQGQSRYGGEARSYYNYGINGSGSVSIFAMRPGWHAGSLPTMRQIGKGSAKNLRDDTFVWVEGEIPADIDYNEEAQKNADKDIPDHIPTDGYYLKATNANKEASQADKVGWFVAGAFRANRIMSDKETRDIIDEWNAAHPDDNVEYDWKRESGKDFNAETMSLEDTPKFSLKVYHGSGADFTEFDFEHMGEGAGSQVFGWGGYVTSSKKIGKSYAGLTIKNRFPSEYDTAQKQYTLSHVQTFILEGSDKNEAIQKVKGLYNESLDKIEHEHPENNYAISNLKERIETLDEMEKGKLPIPTMSLYEVDIPDDNGSNYLDWENPLSEEQINTIRDALAKKGVDVSSWEKRGFKLDLPFKDVYAAVLPMMMRCEPKEVSKFLSSIGYTGIKYPAGTIQGGAEEGDTNYVIFKPEDMKITEHTKFSIKTYHGSQASFDKFDHSFMGSGEGAQAYGWGTYVSEVEGIAKAYAKQNASFGRISKISKYLGTGKSVVNAMLNPSTHKKTLLRLIDNAIKTNEAIQNSTTFEPMLEEAKKALSELKTAKEMLEGKADRNLYSVEIPDDTGDNYLGWDEHLNAKQIGMWKKALLSVVPESDRAYYEEWADGMLENRKKENNPLTGKDAYYAIDSKYSSKKTSMALSKAGFVGVKVIAQRNTGGNKEGKMNYVIFDENNAQITNHTKFSLRLKSAIEETEPNPSDAQKDSGNYKKGHIKFGGYDYTIENPKGSTRSGKDADGKEWKVTMHDTYGYIRGKFGKDGDHLDMFINDKADLDNWDGDVFVVDQVNPDGSFDEHKVMYGYDSMDDAEKAYLANYSKGWQGLGNITGASKAEFDKWLDTSNRKLKPFADYAKVKFSRAQSVDNDEPKTFEEFLNHPLLKFSVKNDGQRKAAENAYKYASRLRPNKYAQYAIVYMSKPSKIPEYYEKKVLADNWRRFYNRAVRWGNYKLFDLDRPFADQVNEVKGKVPDKFDALDTATNKDNIKGFDRQVSYAAEPRYSLKDEKTLAGVHNITEEKLRKALKLGGFANPSLAVIDTSKGAHDNFGEISFIAPSALLDKRTGKTAGTWITDAYTQRYPSVERQMSEKGSQKFRDWVDSLEYSAADKAEIKRQTEDALSNNNAPAWELMYLKEKGIDIKEYNSKVDYRWKEIIREHPTADDILSSMQNDSELNENVTSLVKHTIIHPTWEKVSLEVRRKIYEETGNKVSPINPQVRKQTKEIFERDYAPTLLDKNGKPKAEDIKKVVEQMVKEHNDTKKYDFYLSKVKASDYVNKNGLYDDYIRWQEKKLDEFGTKNRIFRGYNPDGTRKYVPETLENVSKAMREEAGGQTNGSEYTSFGSFIAKIASRVDSTDEMRANKDKLSSNEDKEEFYEKWSNVYYDLAKFLYNDLFYGEQRLHDIVLQADPKKYAKKEYGITLTPTFMKKLDALKNAVQTELKSAYFETKYNRPIRLNEFAAAVVPDNLGEDVRNGIENAGLPMFDYDPNKEGDRNRAFNEAINSSDNIRFSLRYDQFEHELNRWKNDNNLPKDAKRPTIPQRNVGESAVDFLKRVDEYRKQMALWKTAPTYEQHLLSDDTALGEFNRELQKGSVLKRIAFQDSMLAIRKAQEAIMKEVGVDRLNMAEDAYTAENRSHGKGKNEFEEYNNEFLQPLRKAYHQMKKVLGDSYDNVRIYMMAKHGLERDAQMAFKMSLEADYEDVAQRSAAYRAYKGDINRMGNDSGFELGLIDYATWVRTDNAIKMKYSPSYMNYRYDKMGITFDYSGLSALFDGSDFEEAAHKLVSDIESKHIVETKELWDATNAATKKILRDGYKAGMMSKDTYQYVRDMYSHYIPLRGWDGTTADQVWDYVGGGNGAFNQTLKKAHGRTSIADDPIAYIENMAESGILLNNKNWVKQHLMLLAQNHPTSLLTLSKAWYVKSTDANGNEEWIPATPQITSQMNSNQVKAAIDAFEQKMEQMEQTGDATQKRDGLNIAYPQTHSEEREHEVRVMKDGEEYVIYVNGDPQLAQAMNNTRAHRVREIQSGKLDRAAAWLGRKMAAAYTSLSPLFIPSNYFRDLTMTLASTAIREDAKYNYLLRKNLVTSWNLGFMLRDFQNGKLREKVRNGNATPKEQMFYDFMMNGGETGFVSSLDVEDLKKKFKNDLKDLDRWKANPVKVGHTIMDSIEFLNRAIEDSNRFAVYMTSIQYGRSIDEAVNDAKNVTLNFNRKGTGEHSWQTIRNLYLFINPAVQSLQTLGALAKHHPFKFTAVTASWLASGVLVPIVNAALIQMAAAFCGGDGDDDKEWYKDISKKYWQFSKWDRRNNFIMWVPFTHEFIKIPLAQEFRAFYGVGDMIASKMMGGELAEQSWEDYGWDLLGQVVDMLPLDPTGYDGNILVSICPNAIRPIAELAFNVDFTGKPLFKDTEYNKYDPNFTKAYVGTPDWLVRASRMMNSIGNDYPDVQQNKWDALGNPRFSINNPAVVDHVLSSYLGGAYTMGSQVLGLLTKSLNDPKEIKVADIPLFSKFVSNPDDRPVSKKQGDEFWNMKENHDRAANTLSKLKKQAKVDGDYSMLERFFSSEEYKQYKQDDVKVKKYEEDKKKERAEESGEEYRPHKLNADDIYKAHANPKDDFEDLKLKQLYTKLNGFKSTYDLLVDTAPSQSDVYYNANKAAIDAINDISFDKQEISELKKGFLDDGKDGYNADDMKRIRELRKKVLAVLEKANKVVVDNQKANAKKK